MRTLVNQSESAIKFLTNKNIDLSVKSQLGGHSRARTLRNQSGPNIGFVIISALQAAAQRLSNIHIITSANVTNIEHRGTDAILYEIEGQSYRIQGRAIIFATGGFASNQSLLVKYRSTIANLSTTSSPCATGDGIQLATSAYRAQLVDMDQIQVHPTGFVDPADRGSKQKLLAPEALRGSGGILVNEHGRRFVDELCTRDVVSSAVFDQPNSHAFLILDKVAAETFGLGTLQFYMKRGLVAQCSNLAQISEFISRNGDASADILTDTINEYCAAAANREDQFGQATPPFDSGNSVFYVMEVVPVLHYCLGGLKFDCYANVLDEDGKLVPGVFAAGEVTGGLHGTNRLAGNSLLECVVFGRIAARSAVAYVLSGPKSLAF